MGHHRDDPGSRDDDYTRELADRYGHGDGGYDRSAYRQGGHGESASDQGGFGRGLSGDARGDDRRGHEGRGGRSAHRGGAFGERGYGEGRGFGASQGDDRFRTGVFAGGADQDMRSGGQYQGESGYGARGGGDDFTGGGYLGRGSVDRRPGYEPRSGGSFGEDPRGWHGPSGARGQGGDPSRGGGGFRGRGPKNYTRADQRITEDLCERLTDDDDIDASGIEVTVQEGVATLTGTVAKRWMKHRAEDLAEVCGGVRDVDNRIRVDAGGADTRTGTGAQPAA